MLRPRRVVHLLLVAIVLVLGGCALPGSARNPFLGGADGQRTIAVDVRNDNFADATIYVFRGGERVRAGVVVGKGRQTFRVPWTVVRTFQVEIDLLGGGRCLTREFQVGPGDRIEVEVPLDISTDPDCRGR